MDERELILRVRAGDAVAERELYEAHVDRVFRLAYRVTGDETLAQDVTQDTFVRAFERLHEFRGESVLSTWLYAIANSVALNTLRKVKRIRTRELDIEHGEVVTAAPVRAEPDLKEKLHRAIDALPEKYRVVFLMHDVEGFKHHEIARMLGTQVGTAKAQLSRARAKLRDALEEFAGEWVT